MSLFEKLLLAQILMGALDTVWHHELTEKLGARPTQRIELKWHAIRSALYGVMFVVFALFSLSGVWLLLPAGLFVIELVATLSDFVEEDRSRILPATERVLHSVLAINAGAMVFAFVDQHQAAWMLPNAIYVQAPDAFGVFLLVTTVLVWWSAWRDAHAAFQPAVDEPLLLTQRHLRVLVTGGSGFIGSALIRRLVLAHHDITVMTRDPRRTSLMFGGGVTALDDPVALRHRTFDVVVNLAGAPVVGMPWTRSRRRVLWDSRVTYTRQLVAELARQERVDAPVFIQASAMGYYGQRAQRSDETSPAGTDFAGQLCAAWENAAELARDTGWRLVVLRLGLVMGSQGGILRPLRESAKFGFASVIGHGKQPFPWIHLDDVLATIEKVVVDRQAAGPYNLCAPESVDQAQFTRALAQSLHRPAFLHVPEFAMALLGDMADMLLHSPPAGCSRLIESGYHFRRGQLASALRD